MVSEGMTQATVAKEFGASVRSMQIWIARNRRKQSLENRMWIQVEARGLIANSSPEGPKSSRPNLSRRHHSARKLARK